jgi:predicted Zn finger-like uncharacterized protein
MRIECPKCKAAYKVDDTKLPEKGVNVKCRRCQTRFLIKKQVTIVKTLQDDNEKKENILEKKIKTKKCPRCGLPQKGLEKCEYCDFTLEKNKDEIPITRTEEKIIKKHTQKKSGKKKYLVIGIGAILIIFIIGLIITGSKNTNLPDYIKDIVVYKEGDGIIFYFVLADKEGQPTAFDGWIIYRLTCGLEESYNIPVMQDIKKVTTYDFNKAKIGRGAFETDTILFSFERIPYYTLRSNIKEYGEKGRKKDLELFGSKTKTSSKTPSDDIKRQIRKILSSEHKNGKVEILFLFGELPSEVINLLNSYQLEGILKFNTLQIKLYQQLIKSQKSKKNSWNIITGKEKVIF